MFAISVAVQFAPASAVPSSPPGADLAVHLAVFAALGYTCMLAGLPVPIAAVALPVYGGLSELIQTLPQLGRSASTLDWACDVLGAALGLGVAMAVRRTGRWWAPARS